MLDMFNVTQMGYITNDALELTFSFNISLSYFRVNVMYMCPKCSWLHNIPLYIDAS